MPTNLQSIYGSGSGIQKLNILCPIWNMIRLRTQEENTTGKVQLKQATHNDNLSQGWPVCYSNMFLKCFYFKTEVSGRLQLVLIWLCSSFSIFIASREHHINPLESLYRTSHYTTVHIINNFSDLCLKTVVLFAYLSEVYKSWKLISILKFVNIKLSFQSCCTVHWSRFINPSGW